MLLPMQSRTPIAKKTGYLISSYTLLLEGNTVISWGDISLILFHKLTNAFQVAKPICNHRKRQLNLSDWTFIGGVLILPCLAHLTRNHWKITGKCHIVMNLLLVSIYCLSSKNLHLNINRTQISRYVMIKILNAFVSFPPLLHYTILCKCSK